MSNVLRIDWIQVKDEHDWQASYSVAGRLVGIIGPIDRGKSSMVDCIDFLFGRTVHFKGAVDEHLRAVRAQMHIGDGSYVLQRSRNRPGTVSAKDAVGDEQGPFPLRAGEGQQSLSDWLLAQLGLDDAFASVRLPGDKRLNFTADLLPYLHIRQEDIDRFVVRATSKADDESRIAVLDILLYLSNAKLERTKSQIHDLENDIRRRENKAREISDFLNSTEETNADAIEEEIRQLGDAEIAARDRLARLKEHASVATGFAHELRDEVERSRSCLAVAEEAVDWALQRHRDASQKIATLDDSLAKLADVESIPPEHHGHLALIYPTCPACETSLVGRVVSSGLCSLCTEPLPGTAQIAEKTRLQQTREHVARDLKQAEADLSNAREAASNARNDFDQKRKELDDRTHASVTPYVDAIATATSDLESIRSQLVTLQRLRAPQKRLSERYDEISSLKRDLDSARAQKSLIEAELNNPAEVLERINDLFRTIVQAFQLPWATGRARLDHDTLLPMVDEQDFAQRGGGSRTAVSVAYSLALLMYALEYPALFQLPSFLIIDSPQKNIGRNSHDNELAKRIYQWIGDYFEDRRKVLGGRYETFQLLIVDNNIPSEVREHFDKIVQLEENNGFIRDLRNPHGQPEQLQLPE